MGDNPTSRNVIFFISLKLNPPNMILFIWTLNDQLLKFYKNYVLITFQICHFQTWQVWSLNKNFLSISLALYSKSNAFIEITGFLKFKIFKISTLIFQGS